MADSRNVPAGLLPACRGLLDLHAESLRMNPTESTAASAVRLMGIEYQPVGASPGCRSGCVQSDAKVQGEMQVRNTRHQRSA